MKVVIYVRVSTQEQAREGYSIGEQIERLTKYCEAMGWTVVEVYVDPGYSGGDTNRPGLKKMLKDIAAGGIDKVVVYKLDRLSRSQKDTLFLIEDEFLKNNVDFVSMNENFDTSTPFGRAMIGILAVFAQLEREQIRERMSMGKEARAKEGKWNGGNTLPVGYDYDPVAEKFIINDYEAMQIREMIDLFLAGTPLRTIERIFKDKGYKKKSKVGAWDPKTMRRVMRSKIYLGYMRYNDEWYKAEHDPIIDKPTFDKCNRLLDKRAEDYKHNGAKPLEHTTYLGGLLYCKHCGGRYAKQLNSRYKEGKPKVYWYSCYSRSKKMKKMIKDPNCKNKNWKVSELDALILAEIRKLTTDPGYYETLRQTEPEQDPEDKRSILRSEISKIDDQISRFMDLYGLGSFTIDQVNDKVKPLNDTRTKLQNELDALDRQTGRLTPVEAQEIIAGAADVLDCGDFQEIRDLIGSLIYRIELDNEDITIFWKFV